MTTHTSLLNENDRTVALVIAYTPLHNGAEILARLTPERQSEIVRQIALFQPDDMPGWSEGRTCRMGEVCCPCSRPGYTPWHPIGGIDLAERLLARLDRVTCQTILDTLSRNAPELAGCIRRRMWLFEDIARLADPDIVCLLRNVETSQWAIALKDSNEELKEKIYKNISKRAAKMLQFEIDYPVGRGQSDIESVRREIVDIMRLLEDAGELCKPESDVSRSAGSDETGKKILLAIVEKIGKERFELWFGNDTTCRSDECIVIFTVCHTAATSRIRQDFSPDIDEAILAVLGIKKPYDFNTQW
jgi:hypothetical protein